MILNLDETCQIDCVFCKRRSEYDSSKKPSTLEIFSQISNSQDKLINFTGGGEPTLNSNLPSFIRFAKKLGKTTILETNALAFSDVSYLKLLLSCGLDKFRITIISHDSEIYDKIVQTSGAFKLLIKALQNLSEVSNKIVTISLPFTKLNSSFEHFLEFLDFLKKYKIKKSTSLLFHVFRPSNTSEDIIKYLPNHDVLGKEMIKIFSYCEQENIPFDVSLTTPIPLCKIKGFEKKYFSLSTFKTYYDYKSFFTYLPECSDCLLLDKCLGVSKVYLKIHKFTPEPF